MKIGRPRPEPDPFWTAECPTRGPALQHRHDRDCAEHPVTVCCHCGHDAATWAMLQTLIAEPVDIDEDKPLALRQSGTCSWGHASTRQMIGDKGLEWETCPGCGTQKEPRLATGELRGPAYGPGKGYVTARMRRRWEEIAFRARREARTLFTRSGQRRRQR